MRNCASLLISVLAIAGPALPQGAGGDLPSVDKVFDAYIQAEGGKAALEKVNSRLMKGTIEVPTFGASGTFTQWAKAPDKLFNESVFEGYGTVTQAYDGKTAWMDSPDQPMHDMTGTGAMLFQRSADFHRSAHLKSEYKKAAVTGKAKVGQRDAWLVEAEPNQGGPEKLYFDVENGLLLRTELPGDNGQMVVTLEDYKEVDGVKVPHTIKQDNPELSVVVKVQSVQHNVDIADAKFSKPAK